jgi:hypothetical protein
LEVNIEKIKAEDGTNYPGSPKNIDGNNLLIIEQQQKITENLGSPILSNKTPDQQTTSPDLVELNNYLLNSQMPQTVKENSVDAGLTETNEKSHLGSDVAGQGQGQLGIEH